jgi:ABC-2 type transport system permease protein
VSQPATLIWFARHELSLAWRDWLAMMTAGKRSRERKVAIVLIVLAAILHLIAYGLVGGFADAGINPDKTALIAVTGTMLISFSMMLSQAMESVTRAFYARADLDLILSSPASAHRVFALRIGAIALATTMMALLLAGPFINVLVLKGGVQWLAAYGVLAAMGAIATTLALALTIALFRTIGPRRTRFIAQVIAAVVGAAFVIGIQAAAILSIGSISRLAFFRSEAANALAPALESMAWWPARAAMGDAPLLLVVLGAGLGLLLAAIAVFSARFADHVTAAAGIAHTTRRQHAGTVAFRAVSPGRALRRKEWTLLRRDPWLVSQTLMQILYLLPPALLLWRNFGTRTSALLVLVPVLVMASGQLAGGLAWLAVSGEDAPDLVAGAPLQPGAIIRAKIEAVLGAIAVVLTPLLIALAFAAPKMALIAAIGSACAATAATAIQLWFRVQANRSYFRRRQTSSRAATFAEAFSSIAWAGTAALWAMGTWLAAIAGFVALLTLFGAWLISPRGSDGY